MPPRPPAVRPLSSLLVLPLLTVASPAAPAAARPSQPCDDWNSPGYFDRATAEEVIACLEAGRDPNACDAWGYTPLHPSVVAALAEAGVGVRARDRSGYEPLWAAVLCSHANPEVIEALLDAGADPKSRDPNGVSPWDVVRSTPELRDSNAYVRMENRAGNGRDDAWGELDMATLAQYGRRAPSNDSGAGPPVRRWRVSRTRRDARYAIGVSPSPA